MPVPLSYGCPHGAPPRAALIRNGNFQPSASKKTTPTKHKAKYTHLIPHLRWAYGPSKACFRIPFFLICSTDVLFPKTPTGPSNSQLHTPHLQQKIIKSPWSNWEMRKWPILININNYLGFFRRIRIVKALRVTRVFRLFIREVKPRIVKKADEGLITSLWQKRKKVAILQAIGHFSHSPSITSVQRIIIFKNEGTIPKTLSGQKTLHWGLAATNRLQALFFLETFYQLPGKREKSQRLQ